jgi:hypothetical protein
LLNYYSRYRKRLDNEVIALHASLYRLLDKANFKLKTDPWCYFHELLGISAHLAAVDAARLPSPSQINMEKPEALNSVAGRFYKDYTKGLSLLGTPNGKLAKVCLVTILKFV